MSEKTPTSLSTLPADDEPVLPHPHGGITFRGFLLGMLLVLAVAVLAPINDYVLRNNYLIGNHLPLTVIAVIALLCGVVNPILDYPAGSLRRCGAVAGLAGLLLMLGLLKRTLDPEWLPRLYEQTHLPAGAILTLSGGLVAMLLAPVAVLRRRFTTTELTLAIAMMVIACGLPTSGMFRYFPGVLGTVVYHISNLPYLGKYVAALPDWMLISKDPSNPAVRSVYLGLPHGSMAFGPMAAAWARPLAAWAFFVVPFLAAMLLLCALMRKQWVVRERLSFPLAAIPLELLAAPEPGRRFNKLWSSPVLWLGVLIPLGIHVLDGLHVFYPNLPEIKLKYDLTTTFTEYPWNMLIDAMKRFTLMFSVVGVTFFVPLEVSFSVWFFFVAWQVLFVLAKANGADIDQYDRSVIPYQTSGIYLMYMLIMLWISRQHLREALAAAWRWAPREPQEFLPYWASVYGTLACVLVMVLFLSIAGMHWWFAAALVILLLGMLLILTRAVIEAGVLFVQFPLQGNTFKMLVLLFQGGSKALALTDWVVASLATHVAAPDPREHVLPFAANATRMGVEADPRQRGRFLRSLALAVLAALLASLVTHFYLNYRFGIGTLHSPPNTYASEGFPREVLVQAQDGAEPMKSSTRSNPLTHFLIGTGLMGVVSFSRLFLTSSPLHPVGLLLLNSYAIYCIWFSVALGWVLKFIVLRWGGSGGYQKARPFFMGLLVGEAFAAMLWMLVGFLVTWPNNDPYKIMPG